ncbi:MAG TPA: hypothetical protein VGC60_15855, partial [Pyrinomonadaceae bacterium]
SRTLTGTVTKDVSTRTTSPSLTSSGPVAVESLSVLVCVEVAGEAAALAKVGGVSGRAGSLPIKVGGSGGACVTVDDSVVPCTLAVADD